MRERPVPCRFASFREQARGFHMTWNDSAVCDNCKVAAPRNGGLSGAAGIPPSTRLPRGGHVEQGARPAGRPSP